MWHGDTATHTHTHTHTHICCSSRPSESPAGRQLCLSLGECSSPADAVAAFLQVARAAPSLLAGPDGPRAVAEARAGLLFTAHARRATPAGAFDQARRRAPLGEGTGREVEGAATPLSKRV